MAIGNKRYSHFNAQKHETIKTKYWGGGIRCVVFNQIIGGMSSVSPSFVAYGHSEGPPSYCRLLPLMLTPVSTHMTEPRPFDYRNALYKLHIF